MVGHHAPSNQAIALVVEVQQSVLHQICEALVAQPAGPMTGVLVAEEALAQLGVCFAGRRERFDLGQLGPPGLDYGIGHGVVQAKGEGLRRRG
jgi:hypothetical protein